MLRGFEFLALDLTHRCNLDCGFCGKMRWDSLFQITEQQLARFCELCNPLPAKFVRVSGGEATTHPQFRLMITMILNRMHRPIELATNGLLLHKYEDMIPLFKTIHITIYPNINDEPIARYRDLPNVNIINQEHFYDPFCDPDYTVEQGQAAYDACCRAQINVANDKVYGCCVAETLERRSNIGDVHVDLAPGWMEEYKKKSCIAACQHCPIAADSNWV